MLENEYAYYKANRKEICEKYPERFVVIFDGSIIGVYENRVEAIKESLKTHNEGTFLVQGTSEKENVPWMFANSWYSVG